MKALEKLLVRLQEASTWRGLIVIASIVGWSTSPENQEIIISAGVGLIAAIEVFRNEKKEEV
jgi:hypothetical protein